MAGILANSASQTMVSGDTAASKVVTSYQLNERITLTASPAGTDYSWTQGLPSGASETAALTGTTGASVSFVPTAAGQYTIVVDVDGADYTMYLSVNAATVTSGIDIWRASPIDDADVATPPTGHFQFYNSNDQGGLSVKDSAGLVQKIQLELDPPTTVTTTPYTALTNRVLLIDDDAVGGVATVNLPAAADNIGRFYDIKKLGTTGNVIIDGNSAETIDGAATQTITTQYTSMAIVSDGTSWHVI